MSTLAQALAAEAGKPAPSDDDLETQAEPLPAGPGLDVDIADIPKPPKDLVGELDNEGAGAEPEAQPEVAELDFCGVDLPWKDFPLKYPFRWQGGDPVKVITVSQLTTQQMGGVVREAQRRGRAPELYDVYAVMTGWPAAVLRALPAVDGEPITDACFDFLPPLLRPDSG